MRVHHALLSMLAIPLLWVAACDDDEPPPDDDGNDGRGLVNETGQACAAPADCYTAVPDGEIEGDVVCLDRVEGGYCTHECVDDDDCCAAPGECDPGEERQVCGPFESSGQRMCFISCEDEDLDGADPEAFCGAYGFICRSTGGGSENRKICVPAGGDPCDLADDCPGDFPYCCADAFTVYRCYDEPNSLTRTCL
jgi:hypothetical protein